MVRSRQGDVEIDLAADSIVRGAIEDLSRHDPGRRLEAANRIRHTVDALVTEFVAAARADGATWAEIGEILGVSTQAAHQKYRWVTLDLTDDAESATVDADADSEAEAGAASSDSSA